MNISSPSSLEVKNEWIYTSSPSIYLHCVDTETSFFKIINVPLRDRIQTTSTRINSRITVIAILLFLSAAMLHKTWVINSAQADFLLQRS